MRDFYMAQSRAREIEENTGITLAQQAEMPLDEWSRLAYGQTPAQAALATFYAQDEPGKPSQPAAVNIAATFAELERDMIQVRTLDGLAAARARGRVGGRKAKLTDAQAAEVRRLYAAREKTVAEIGSLFGITRESVYRYLKAGQDDAQAAAKPGRKRTVEVRAS
jgi:DNA invertase Pin-like site-specific DNA recombinase